MPVTIFFSYSHEDEPLLFKLKTHLRPLQRVGLIELWYDRDISAGTEWEQEITKHLNTSQIILLLVSPDFIDSDYCYSIEMKRALERHEQGEGVVIPIILRSVYWQGTPFGKLQALPTNGKPIVSSSWHNQDEAFLDITQDILKVVKVLISKSVLNSLPSQQTVNQTAIDVSTILKAMQKAIQLEKQFAEKPSKKSFNERSSSLIELPMPTTEEEETFFSEVLKLLPPIEQKSILLLVSGFTLNEIASELGISVRKAATLTAIARAKFRKLYRGTHI
jgi:hypothetical protein